MEAKVDVRKLQVLNDRINQTIDALNQVRVSVHGLGHTGMQQMNPFLGQGFGVQQGLGLGTPFGTQSPFGTLGLYSGIGGQQGQQGFPGLGIGLGLQHSPFTPYANPFTNPFMNPFTNPFSNPFTNPYTNPYTTQGVISPWGIGQTPLSGTPWGGLGGVTGGLGGGLFHSSPDIIDRQIAEVRASDPYRIAQTFPFVIP